MSIADPLIGTTVAQYLIVAKLGGGAMGVVYQARDLKLGRVVALKFLPPQWSHDETAQQRFMREAQAASATDHQNICTIYNIETTVDGRLFIVMAYYDGQTLKQKLEAGALGVKEALDIAAQIAEGLVKTHAQGVVHRDIKPGNLMVTADGVKILDFGLAKLADSLQLTMLGSTVGTVVYMSPEQVRGEEADPRSDVWALGIVLYEMLAGQPPFKGSHPEAVCYAIKNEPVPPLRISGRQIPEEIEQLILKALAKDPSERFQSAHELLGALDSLRRTGRLRLKPRRRMLITIATALVPLVSAGVYFVQARRIPEAHVETDTSRIRSLMVLPFRNLNDSKAIDYFGLGLADVLKAKLAGARFLEVRVPRGALGLMDPKVDQIEVARSLGVDAVLTGSYRLEGGILSMSYTLTDVRRNAQIAGDAVQDSFTNTIAVEHRLASQIVDWLKLSASPSERARITTTPTREHEAFQAYLRSRYEMDLFWREPSADQLRRVQRELESALQHDVRFSLALVSLATLRWVSVFWGYETDPSVLDRAKQDAAVALQEDPGFGEAYAAIALVEFQRGHLDNTRQNLREAFTRAPNSALAHYAAGFYFMGRGLPDYSIRAFLRARELDPQFVRRELGLAYRYAGDLVRAGEHLRADLRDHPGDLVTALSLAAVDAAQGDLAAAREIQRTLIPAGHDDPNVQYLAALLDTLEKKPFSTRRWIDRFRDVYWSDAGYCVNVSGVLAAAGESGEAVRWLMRAGELGMKNYPFVAGNPLYASLRQDPGFQSYLSAVQQEWQRERTREERDPILPRPSRAEVGRRYVLEPIPAA